jgi:outer membrane protein insertion porin family
MKKILFSILILLLVNLLHAQEEQFPIDYSAPKKFTIAAVNVIGSDQIDKNVIIAYSGLAVGNEIFVPSDDITKAITNLWKQKMFSDIRIEIASISGSSISLIIVVKTRPRLSRYSIKGITKNEADKVREKISLRTGDIVTDQLLQNATNQIKSFLVEKGFFYPDINIIQDKDTLLSDNSIKLNIIINKNKKVRIKEIEIEGNDQITSKRIRRLLKKTKRYQFWNVFRSSKMINDLYEEDKDNIITYYNSKGYRDARIISDTVYPISKKYLKVHIKLHEGKKYYFRNISWSGNTKYTSEQLEAVLGIKKGDIYDLKQLDQKLSMSPSGIDVSSLYMDNGYLFFNVKPIETQIIGDSIDIELRLFEGPQAIINKIIVSGNLKTSDYVILREIRTRPGQKFSRADVIRSQRELSQLGYFDPEQMNIIPVPNIENGTVNIEYKLTEKPADQLQLQGGWGAGQFVGSIAIVFTNFSSRKIFKLKEWRPLPSGDGQSVSFRFQSNAVYYTSYNISFTEPWLGGKKPNSFTISAYYQRQTNGIKQGEPNRQQIDITGGAIGLGKRLRWPDDYFTMYNEVTLQRYDLVNYNSEFSFSNGISNNLNFRHVISRNSVDQPIYPRSGSSISLSVQWTPPFSLFSNKDYSKLTDQEKYKWVEYHKWKFDASWYLNIFAKLVLNTKVQFGYLGQYNKELGITPFERFYIGGDGLGNYNLLGREYVALRGYDNSSLTAENYKEKGGTIFNKYVFELRYPLSLNPQATIYALGFAEAGNSWLRFNDFDPFKVYRSLGLGVRIFMPYFGQLGFDWGYGFDNVPGKPDVNKGNFHISIGQQF